MVKGCLNFNSRRTRPSKNHPQKLTTQRQKSLESHLSSTLMRVKLVALKFQVVYHISNFLLSNTLQRLHKYPLNTPLIDLSCFQYCCLLIDQKWQEAWIKVQANILFKQTVNATTSFDLSGQVKRSRCRQRMTFTTASPVQWPGRCMMAWWHNTGVMKSKPVSQKTQ